MPDAEIVVAYHERTKHHFRRYAAAPGYMDWATQPDPFRRYSGAPLIHLPLPEEGNALEYWKLYAKNEVESRPLTIKSLSLFFRYALSLTAWKQIPGATWALRANPSSGNLHPTEGYALLPAISGIHDQAGVYHYAPKEHGLELRAEIDFSSWHALTAGFSSESFLVALSSIFWREAWKYGERAFRYCQHDTGHALGSMRFAAAALGWNLSLIDGVNGTAISRLLGLDRDSDYGAAEREHPELLALVTPKDFITDGSLNIAEAGVSRVGASRWNGMANTLSVGHGFDWPVIDQVTLATMNFAIAEKEHFSQLPLEEELFLSPVRQGARTAERVILGRRSAVCMDASSAIPAMSFFRMMARLSPTRNNQAMPWDSIPWRPRIHLVIFVHRVDGLAPGLYALVRDPDKKQPMQQNMRRDFVWELAPGCPPGLGLYLLLKGDCRALAANVSCGQAIAGDSAFSLGMIAEYMDSLAARGAAFYRNLFWEAGLLGQVLYLEAEEEGIRSTGIGCYFDDAVHEVFGISSREWQSLYHFTVGGPVEDDRLSTLPAYSDEGRL
jgi:SagB-type dehydrogenase family enzyme